MPSSTMGRGGVVILGSTPNIRIGEPRDQHRQVNLLGRGTLGLGPPTTLEEHAEWSGTERIAQAVPDGEVLALVMGGAGGSPKTIPPVACSHVSPTLSRAAALLDALLRVSLAPSSGGSVWVSCPSSLRGRDSIWLALVPYIGAASVLPVLLSTFVAW